MKYRPGTLSRCRQTSPLSPLPVYLPGNNFCARCCCPQTKAGRGEDPRGQDTGLLGGRQEGGSGVARHVSHMPENQVRRRRRPHLQLLQHPVLRTLRRKGQSTVEQGRGEIRKRSGKIYRAGGIEFGTPRPLIPSAFPFLIPGDVQPSTDKAVQEISLHSRQSQIPTPLHTPCTMLFSIYLRNYRICWPPRLCPLLIEVGH